MSFSIDAEVQNAAEPKSDSPNSLKSLIMASKSQFVSAATKTSADYKLGYSKPILSVFERRTAAGDAAHLLPHLKAHSSILDIGCGPGTITLDFAKIVVNGSVVGIDISPESLAVAQNRVEEFKAEAVPKTATFGNITFQKVDVFEGLPFEDDTFDAVYSDQTFVHLIAGTDGTARSTAVMKEIWRVLKPGGIVATRDVCAFHWFPSSHSPIERNRVLVTMLNSTSGSAKPPGGDVPSLMIAAGFDHAKMDIAASTRVISSAQGKTWFSQAIAAWTAADETRERLAQEGVEEMEVEHAAAMVKRWTEDECAWNMGVLADVIAFK